jgi:short-subunit dehydrogenase/AraC-like DNA-binding protein
MSKVVLITGASSGIGRACAYFLAKQDFIVYAGSRTPSKLDISHPNLHPIDLDLTNYEQIKKRFEMIYDKHKRVDVLINNAGYGLISSVEHGDEEEMQRQFDINVFSIFRVCKAAIPYMKNKKEEAVIINIGSYFGKVAFPLFAFYSAIKFSVEGLNDALTYELKGLGIRVHMVIPGFTKSNFTHENLVENLNEKDMQSSYKKVLRTLPQLMSNIKNGSEPIAVAQNILDTINNKDADKRVYVENDSHKIFPLKEALTDDEQMIYRFYKLELEGMNIDKDDLKIAMDAKEILLKEYVNPPKIAYLAPLCSTNKTKLQQAFKNVYKMSIPKYVKKIRLEKAYHLLKDHSLNIGEVAKTVGYQHQGNFSKLFFKAYGIHPKEILKQNC